DFVETIGQDPDLIRIGLQRRYDPALLYTRKLIQSGLVGEIREIRCILRDQFPPPPTYTSRGLIIDMGVHVADEVSERLLTAGDVAARREPFVCDCICPFSDTIYQQCGRGWQYCLCYFHNRLRGDWPT